MERRLSAILAADVVGFSRLMEADEAGTFERLREHLKQLFEPEIAKHHGRIFKIMGDGLLAEFTSVVDAVECAVSLQRGMAERNQSVAEQERMQVRIGINLGEVIVEGDDRYGEGVNIAARLQQLAEPGGICVSDKVSKEVEKKLAFGFEPIGQQRVKNIAEPILVYRVNLSSMPRRRLARRGRSAIWPLAAIASIILIVAAAVGTFVFSGLESQQLAGKPAIAVLPFASPGDEASARLGDGLTDDVITDLSRFRSIDVIARNSTEAYGSKPIDVRQIGKDLNINYVVVGSIQREGKQIRVTAQLIEATTGRNVWSDRWDRPTEDVFAVQSEIADAIARRLAEYGAITGAELAKAKRKPPQDLSAYELYLLGSDAQSSMTKEGMDKSIELISAALKRDPTLARAWVELGWAHANNIWFGADEEASKRGEEEAARRALEIDPTDSEAHAMMGEVYGYKGQFDLAAAEFERALTLNPSDTVSLGLFLFWSAAVGQAEKGAEAADRLIRLDPNYETFTGQAIAYAYFMVGRYEDTLRVLSRIPDESLRLLELVNVAASHAALGHEDRAKAAVAKTLERFPDLTIQGYLSDVGWSEAERERLLDTMRRAGFALCEKNVSQPDLLRLPECPNPQAS